MRDRLTTAGFLAVIVTLGAAFPRVVHAEYYRSPRGRVIAFLVFATWTYVWRFRAMPAMQRMAARREVLVERMRAELGREPTADEVHDALMAEHEDD